MERRVRVRVPDAGPLKMGFIDLNSTLRVRRSELRSLNLNPLMDRKPMRLWNSL
jgi:hypothetical protein